LNEIGFIWNVNEESWDAMITALTKYKQREGHLRVPTRHVEDGQNLGTWIRRNRDQQWNGTFVPENERRLHEIGFVRKQHLAHWMPALGRYYN
jgi:hypothetical protein